MSSRTALVTALLLVSCGERPPCDASALQAQLGGNPDAARSALLASCDLPDPLRSWVDAPSPLPPPDAELWAAACPDLPPPTEVSSIDARQQIYRACKLGRLRLSSAQDFALSAGRPVLAAALQVWLGAAQDDPALAKQVATAVMGPPRVQPGLPLEDLPRVGSADDAKPVQASLGADGPSKPLKGLDSLAAPASLRLDTLREQLGNQAGRSLSLAVVVSSDHKMIRLGAVPLSLSARAVDRVRQRGELWERVSATGEISATGTLDAVKGALKGDEALEINGQRTLQELLTTAAHLGLPARLVLPDQPCREAPAGMVCVPEGPARVRAGDSIELSTFYLDRTEVSRAAYQRCVDAGFCPSPATASAAEQPVLGIGWEGAWRYCAWVGKRLPSEWEWEKAARGPDGPDPAPSCATPHAGCPGASLVAVGAAPEGSYGLRGLAGNAAEWTGSWIGPRSKGCEKCDGVDPLGPCEGSPRCKGYTTKAVRGGSFADKPDALRPSARRAVSIYKPGPHTGLRCATADPVLHTFPSSFLREPRPVRAIPAPPSQADRARAAQIDEDDLAAKAVCTEDQMPSWTPKGRKSGVSTVFCRDPASYLTSNEPRRYTWGKYIANIGGGYLGVGADQAYDFIAAARSDWAWPFDYDPNVVRVHRVVKALILGANDRADFLSRFDDGAVPASVQRIRDSYQGDRADELVAFYKATRGRLGKHYRASMVPLPEAPEFGWLATEDNFAYIRALYTQGRIVPVGGDMLGSHSMRSIGETARAMGVPIRVYYPSNAPLAWGGKMTPEYRANLAALPFDDQALVIASYNTGGFGQTGYWHHNVQDAKLYSARLQLEGYWHVKTLFWDRIPTDDPDVTVCGVR